MGYLRVLWSRGCKIPVPEGSRADTLGAPVGSIRAMGFPNVQVCGNHVDDVRAWEYPHDQWCRALRGPVKRVNRKVQEEPQAEAAANPRHQEEEKK